MKNKSNTLKWIVITALLTVLWFTNPMNIDSRCQSDNVSKFCTD